MQYSDTINIPSNARQSPGNTDKYYSQPNYDIKDYTTLLLWQMLSFRWLADASRSA